MEIKSKCGAGGESRVKMKTASADFPDQRVSVQLLAASLAVCPACHLLQIRLQRELSIGPPPSFDDFYN